MAPTSGSTENTSASDPGKPPLPHDVLRELGQSVVEFAVFAPIGFLRRARTLVPELVNEGKATAQSAQLIGRFAVPLVKRQSGKVVQRTMNDLRRAVSGGPTESPASTAKDVAKVTRATKQSAKATVVRPPKAAPTATTPTTPTTPTTKVAKPALSASSEGTTNEPFAGYDHLGSAAVVARLGELSAQERAGVRSYEVAHRNRRTVLGRLDQLDSSR